MAVLTETIHLSVKQMVTTILYNFFTFTLIHRL